MRSLIAALGLMLLVSGCGSQMQAEVTQFSNLPASPSGRNFAVVAEPAQSGNLEFQYYAGLVGGALQAHGLVAAPANLPPDLVVQIHYASTGNHTETYGYYGYGCCYRRHGLFGPELESVTYYGESLEVQIFDGPSWRNNVHTMLYQGRAVGDSRVNEISDAVPALVQALFAHFPGNSGRTERVIVPLAEQGKPPVSAAPPPGQSKIAG